MKGQTFRIAPSQPGHCLLAEQSPPALERRRKLRDVVDGAVKDFEASDNAALMDSDFANAFRLMTSSKARDAFDLSREPATLRDRSGGRSPLM